MSKYRTINDSVKVYPDMLQINIYHTPYQIPVGTRLYKQTRKSKSISKNVNSIHRSTSRSKQAIYDIIYCNKFDYWCTFTFDRKKHDRFNIDHCRTVMSLWLHNQKKHSPDMSYVVVPEFHKKCQECTDNNLDSCSHDDRPKALHFHALISNFNGRLKDTGLRTKKGQKVYNATGYRSGFTKFIELYENGPRLANYMTKYITKEMPKFHGKKRYWVSRGLERPQTYVNGITHFALQKLVWHHENFDMTDTMEIQYHKRFPGTSLTRDAQQLLIDVPATVQAHPRRSGVMVKKSREGIDLFDHASLVDLQRA